MARIHPRWQMTLSLLFGLFRSSCGVSEFELSVGLEENAGTNTVKDRCTWHSVTHTQFLREIDERMPLALPSCYTVLANEIHTLHSLRCQAACSSEVMVACMLETKWCQVWLPRLVWLSGHCCKRSEMFQERFITATPDQDHQNRYKSRVGQEVILGRTSPEMFCYTTDADARETQETEKWKIS